MADNQDFSEDLAHGDFSNESCGDFQDQNSNQAHDQTSNDATSNGDQPTDASEKHKEEASHNSHADHSQDGPQSKDEDRKLFVGGLSWSTTDKDLKEHFGKYGDIESVTVKMDPQTGRSRGFAFLIFKNAEALDKVIAAGEHVIGGKRVDPKKAKARSGKIFVGGLPQDCSEETIRSFFGQYGRITEVEMPFDRVKNQRKNFCFVTFENETVVFELLKTPKQVINGKEVDVKKATPKLDNFGPPPTRGGRGGGGGGPGSMRGAPRGRGSWGGWGPQGGYGGGGGYGYDGYGYDYYGGDYGYGGGYGDYYGGAQGGYGGGKQRGGRQAPRHQPY